MIFPTFPYERWSRSHMFSQYIHYKKNPKFIYILFNLSILSHYFLITIFHDYYRNLSHSLLLRFLLLIFLFLFFYSFFFFFFRSSSSFFVFFFFLFVYIFLEVFRLSQLFFYNNFYNIAIIISIYNTRMKKKPKR